MAFRQRKLQNDSLHIFGEKTCSQFCDPKKNPVGLCPLPCFPLCFTTCKGTLFFPQDPPPQPAPAAADLTAHPAKHFHMSLFLTVVLSILATTFFLFSFYTAYKFYRNWKIGISRRLEQPREEDDDDSNERFSDLVGEDHGLIVDHPIWYIRTVGLQSSIINAITICKYKRDEGLVEGTECSVCLNEFQEDETLRLLPKCNHAFHIPCIDTWLRSHTNCPMCRAGIVTNSAAAPPAEQNLQSSSGPVLGNEYRPEPPRFNNNSDSSRDLIEREIQNQGSFEIDIEERNSNEENRGGLVNSETEETGEAEIGIRRSISMDSVSAIMVSSAVEKAFAAEFGSKSARVESNFPSKKTERIKGTSSSSSSLMPGLMKRSLSCSGKVLSSRYNRRPNAILPR